MDSHSIMWGYALVFQVKQIYFLQIQRIQRKTNEGGKQLDGMDKKKKTLQVRKESASGREKKMH